MQRLVGLTIWLAFFSGQFALAQEAPPAEGMPTAVFGENISIAVRWVANEYLSPETEKIDRNYLTFESFDEVAGEDIRVEIWGMEDPDAEIWVFVHDRTAEKWWAYGGANPEGNGIWVIHGVRFGEGAHQGRRFTLRAAILSRPPSEKLIDAEEWQPDAVAISDPVYLTVKRRLVRPYPPSDTVASPQLWLSTIDHLTVSPMEPMVVAPSAGIAGTFLLPDSRPQSAPKPYIYVMIRSTATDRWRVFGPAVLNGAKWEVRDVDIADPGEPQWVKFKISAVMTPKKLSPGYVEYQDWWDTKVAASDPVEVAVKALEPTLNRPFPKIQITFLQTLTDTLPIYSNALLPVDSLEEIIQIGGKVHNLPQGASIWLLINPLGTPLWEVHGKAIVTRPQWRLPIVHSERFANLDISQYRLQAVVSTSTLEAGLMEYATWRMNTLSISEGLVIQEDKQPFVPQTRLSLRIETVGGEDLSEPHTRANIRLNPSVQGEINRTPPGVSVWVGTRAEGNEEWHFSGPAFLNERRWKVPNAHFPRLSGNKEHPEARFYDVVAIATRGYLPVSTLHDDQLQWYALATSPVGRVHSNGAESFNFSAVGGSWFWGILLLLLLLGILEYYFRTVSEVCGYLADTLEELGLYLRDQFAEMPKPEVIPSAFGILILGLGVFAIVGYFPIYVHVLERVLKLSPDKSESLALLLIIFIGLAGVIAHLSIEYVSNRPGEFINRVFDYFLNYALPITIFLVTLALWGVQALLYLELYSAQVEPGNIRIPAAMGAAAFFIAGIETLGFYWATRLGKDFMGWLIFHAFLLGPPVILAKFFRMLYTFFQGLPSRENPRAAPALGKKSVAGEIH